MNISVQPPVAGALRHMTTGRPVPTIHRNLAYNQSPCRKTCVDPPRSTYPVRTGTPHLFFPRSCLHMAVCKIQYLHLIALCVARMALTSHQLRPCHSTPLDIPLTTSPLLQERMGSCNVLKPSIINTPGDTYLSSI